MNNSRKRILRIVLVGVLAAIGVQFLPTQVDPRAAQARTTAPTPAPAPIRKTRLTDITRAVDELRKPISIDELALGRDVFAPTPAMLAELGPAHAPEVVEPAPASSQPNSFAQRHRLDGVMLGRRPLAVVDGVVVPLGATFDRHRLIAVDRNGAIFSDGEQRVELRVPIPNQRTGGNGS